MNHKRVTLLFSLGLGISMMSCSSFKDITPDDHSTISSSITPGMTLRLTLKSGEMIRRMKVKEIDSLEIRGIQISNYQEQRTTCAKTVAIAEVEEIKRRKFSPLKTGLLTLTITAVILTLTPLKVPHSFVPDVTIFIPL